MDNTFRKVQGFAFTYGDKSDTRLSVDPMVHGWPAELEIDTQVEIRPVTRHELYLNGEPVSMTDLVKNGLVKCDVEASKEAWKNLREEQLAAKRAERAQKTAEKAVERARALADKAAEKAREAQEKARLIAETAKSATPPKAIDKSKAAAKHPHKGAAA